MYRRTLASLQILYLPNLHTHSFCLQSNPLLVWRGTGDSVQLGLTPLLMFVYVSFCSVIFVWHFYQPDDFFWYFMLNIFHSVYCIESLSKSMKFSCSFLCHSTVRSITIRNVQLLSTHDLPDLNPAWFFLRTSSIESLIVSIFFCLFSDFLSVNFLEAFYPPLHYFTF